MAEDEPDSLVLSEDVTRLETRMSAVEQAVLNVRRDIFQVYEGQVNLQQAMDRHGERLDRIEWRLELLPA